MQFLNKKKKSHTKWIVFTVLFVVIIFFGFFVRPLRTLFVGLTHPVVQTATSLNSVVEKTKTLPLSKYGLTQEIEKVKKENERLVGLLVDLQKEKTETGLWASLFPSHTPADFIRAPIISKPNQSPYDTFLLGVGEADGVTAGAYISINEISLLGTIDTIHGAHRSTGILFSSPNVETHARLERSNYDVILTGRGGGNMIVEVPREIETALGDRVLYPTHYNAVIGVIRDITFDDRNATKKLFITLPTNILTLDHVYIKK